MRKYLILTLLIGATTLVFGQFNLNFYQMNTATPQGNNYNAASFPNARAFVSLPLISGVDLSVNNSFGLSDIFTETGDSSLIDVDRFLLEQGDGAYFNTQLTITDLMIGFRTGKNGFVTVFVNERTDATFFYPFQLVNFIWQGNRNYVGEEYVIDDISYDFTHYREIGVGYGRSFDIFGFNTNLGVRLKYLQGVAHSSIKDNLEMSILTREEDYSVVVNMNEGLSRSAGLNMLQDGDIPYLINNGNTGFAIDLGGTIDLSDRITVGFAANDLGFIKWQDDAETASFNGTSFEINGGSFDNMDQLADAVMDSIENLQIDTIASTFTTSLNSSLFLSGSYRVTDQGYAQATISNYFTQGRMKSAVGIGYLQNLRKWLAASVTFSLASQRGADIGAGLMLRGGYFQTYLSVDHLLNTINVPEASGLNFKFGINFLFGGASKKTKASTSDYLDL
ncbi:MAG: DUF5723 family protein [Marinoscillum sp.]